MVEFFIDSTKVTIAHADTVRLMLDSVKVSLQSSPTQSSEWLVVVKDVTLVVTAWLGILFAISQYLIATRTLKANLLSNSRLKWIDSLRDQLAEFISVSESLRLLRDGKKENRERPKNLPNEPDQITNLDDALQEWKQDIEKLYFVQSKIRLLINPTESDNKQLIEKCDEILKMSFNEKRPAVHIGNAIGELIELSQKILKHEWERVKRFE